MSIKINKKFFSSWKAGIVAIAGFLIVPSLMFLPNASAVSLNLTDVTLNRLATSTATGGTVCAEPSNASDVEGKVLLTFPAGFTVGSSWTTSTAATSTWPTGATAWPSIEATGSGSGQVVTFTSGDLTSSSQVYCFNWTNTSALTTPSSAGASAITVTTETSGGTTLESNTATVDIIGNDQISVTASVNQSFTFSLSSNLAALGTLSTSSPTAATAINATVSTNARSGWQMWADDPAGTPGLTSPSQAHTIAYSPSAGSAPAALTAGNEGYNLGSGTLSGTCNGTTTYGNFASGGTQYKGSGLDNTLRSLVSTTGTASSCALPLTVNASISNTTPGATDYAGTMTVVAAGNF